MLKVESLHADIGGSRILRGVSLEVGPGEVACLMGRNGVGKTTTLKSITGLREVRSGSISLEGKALNGLAPDARARLGIGYVPQGRDIFPHMTVEENLRLAAQVLEPVGRSFLPIHTSRRTRAKVEELLVRFDLWDRRNELAGNLSHGDQRRLEVAVCLASEPKLLMLDEPTQGMSHADTTEAAKMVRALTEDVTVLLIEHDIGLVMELSDHVVVMHQGKKLAEGAPAVVHADPAVQAAYFGHA